MSTVAGFKKADGFVTAEDAEKCREIQEGLLKAKLPGQTLKNSWQSCLHGFLGVLCGEEFKKYMY